MVTAVRARETGSIVAVERIAELVEIFDRDVNAVVHRRRLGPRLEADIAGAIPCNPPKLVAEVGDQLPLTLQRAFGLPAALTEDVAFWVGVVSDLSDTPLVGVRLAHPHTAMCPRFHVDRVMLRVAITYDGPGTELLPDHVVDRSKLAPHHGGAPDDESGLFHDRRAVWRARAGDVVVMKGELWPSDVGGVVHRSPQHTTPRLILTLDPLY